MSLIWHDGAAGWAPISTHKDLCKAYLTYVAVNHLLHHTLMLYIVFTRSPQQTCLVTYYNALL